MKKISSLLVLILFYSLFFQVSLISFSQQIIFPNLLPNQFSSRAWIDLFSNQTILSSFVNSILISFSTVAGTIIFAWPYAVTTYKYRQKQSMLSKTLETLAYLPLAIPILIPAFGLYEQLIKYQLIGGYLSLITTLTIFLFPYMFRSIYNEILQTGFLLEEQASTLGASRLSTFLTITCPRMTPSLFVGSVFVFSGSFNDYLLTYLIGDGEISTLALVVYPLMHSDDFALSCAAIILFIVPFILLILLIPKKQL